MHIYINVVNFYLTYEAICASVNINATPSFFNPAIENAAFKSSLNSFNPYPEETVNCNTLYPQT